MDLDPDQCYAAMTTRDPRFDGRFFVGVRTTGVYCRPVCPARTPLARNVRFFPCAAAAEQAGFRACRRCRPETAPGTPAWVGTGAVVTRALRLIRDGATGDVEELAERLGVGERQLRRLFEAHLGASPGAVARARRVHFARNLLDQTDLPVAEVARAAGYAGPRSLHHAIRAAFGLPPGEIRRARTAGPGISLRLSYRPPFDFRATHRWFAARAIPGVEQVDSAAYRRTVRWDGGSGVVEITQGAGNFLRMEVRVLSSSGGPPLLTLAERARRVFDLDADPVAIGEHLSADPLLRPLVAARPGLRLPGAWDPFEAAIRGILGQQVSVKAATTLATRLVARHGDPIDGGSGLDRLFPAPGTLAAADLAGLGVTRARVAAIQGFARAVAAGELTLDAPRGLDDAIARFCALPGIGPWTAAYIALRALGEPDAFPAGDLGLRLATGLDARALDAAATPWRPWRAYAAIHLWNSLGDSDAHRSD